MSILDLAGSVERATARLAHRQRPRRSDAGQSRMPAQVDRWLTERLQGRERPAIAALGVELRALCARLRVPTPSRATIYNAIARCRPAAYAPRDLPESIQTALYNLDLDVEIDGARLAFYAFNYGDLRAACWAAGMPWLALHHAARMRGWRAKSRGLLLASMRHRGIT